LVSAVGSFGLVSDLTAVLVLDEVGDPVARACMAAAVLVAPAGCLASVGGSVLAAILALAALAAALAAALMAFLYAALPTGRREVALAASERVDGLGMVAKGRGGRRWLGRRWWGCSQLERFGL